MYVSVPLKADDRKKRLFTPKNRYLQNQKAVI